MAFHISHLWLGALQYWHLVRYRVLLLLEPVLARDYPHDVQVTKVGLDAQQVTYKFRGKPYRGHLTSGQVMNLADVRNERCSMKRPTRATDALGNDVTPRIREYWGPAGDWNASVGLRFLPHLDPHIESPVVVKFNDFTEDRMGLTADGPSGTGT